jgi:hypothetical protein
MRASGVPARLVAGYQGGAAHPDNKYWIVRQYDAHAWAEIWYEGKGWTRVDPTAYIHPDRVKKGFDQSYREENNLGSIAGFGRDSFWSKAYLKLNLQADKLRFFWHRSVLGYDSASQSKLWQKLKNFSWKKLSYYGMTLALIVFLVLTLISWRKRVILHPYQKAMQAFLKTMKKKGYVKKESEDISTYLNRLTNEQNSEQSKALSSNITLLWNSAFYQRVTTETKNEEFNKSLKQFSQLFQHSTKE